jgi:ribosomal protein S18 acetylase RimI-like enzyme
MVECLDRLKARGVNTIRLTVPAGDVVVVKLYEKLGFRIYRYGMIKV